MSMCDACRNPGRCCSGFHLNAAVIDACDTELEVLAVLAAVQHPDPWMGGIGLPFLPLFRGSRGEWLLWCPRLGRDGRCTDYENRPAVCRVFEPGTDPLCVQWDGVVRPEQQIEEKEPQA